MKFNKTYSFAFWCAAIIAILSIAVFIVLGYLSNKPVDLVIVSSIVIIVLPISFFVIQRRVEVFIYLRIKKIYDDVSILGDIDDLKKTIKVTDIESLSKEVKKYVEQKQGEISSLNERELYRREFLGNVSHELKTPLFTVQGYLLTLIDGAVNDKQIREKYLQRANKGVERLVAVVEDLDMISKLESNELGLHIQQFNIIELIQDVLDLVEMKAKKSHVTLAFDKQYDAPILVKGDVKRIEQVLINLIINAIKYGKINGVISIGLSPYQNKKVLIKVSDNGEGIKEEHLPRLFERFYRVDQSRSREQGGSGLGLSIVKHIIEAHDEIIMVESVYGEGSKFSFTLKKV